MTLLKKVLKENDINIKSVMKMDFIKDIKNNKGEPFIVGGSIRDEFLGKDSKDIDLIVRSIELNKLINILQKHGKVDLVGKSFGVIKFLPYGYNLKEPIDIALPRTERKLTELEKDALEKKTGKRPKGYQAFTAESNHNLKIKQDLLRRDFTINTIAKDYEGNLYDPFNGKKDLDNKIIRMVSPKSFSDDPLRILRAIQFSSRFNFKIEKNTWLEIKKNANKINEISGERILIELEKIIKKGDPLKGFKLLIDSGVYSVIFFNNFSGDINLVKKSKTLSEFIYSIIQNSTKNISNFYLKKLKGDINIANEIKCLELAWDNRALNSPFSRMLAFDMYKISKQSFNLKLYPNNILKAINDLKNKYPKTLKELEINGNDLISLGHSGQRVGILLNDILMQIYSDNLENTKSNILKYLSKI